MSSLSTVFLAEYLRIHMSYTVLHSGIQWYTVLYIVLYRAYIEPYIAIYSRMRRVLPREYSGLSTLYTVVYTTVFLAEYLRIQKCTPLYSSLNTLGYSGIQYCIQ